MTAEVADDLDEMLALSRPPKRPCSVCVMAESMTPEHRAAFEQGLAHPQVTDKGLLRWLESRGYRIDVGAPDKAISHHKSDHHGR